MTTVYINNVFKLRENMRIVPLSFASIVIITALASGLLAVPNLSEKELNSYMRKTLLKKYKGNDPENYEELLRMVKYDPLKNKLDVFYDCQDYKNVSSDEINDSDEFFARILYPCLRKDSEWGNWITNISLNPKAQYILAKASISLSSWSDVLYMLKITRPQISSLQLSGLKKRKHLLRRPLILDGLKQKKVINCSGYIFNLAMYSFRATMKAPLTADNLKIAKAISVDMVVFVVKRILGNTIDGVMKRRQDEKSIENVVKAILRKEARGKTKRT